MIDFSKMEIKTDETLVDENNNSRKDVLIYERCLVCHPDIENQLREAIKLFFIDKQEK